MIKKRAEAREAEKKREEESPVYPAMASRMQVDFLFNEDGGVWLLHDRPLPEKLEWVEYDADLETVTLVTRIGKIQDMGMKVPARFGEHLLYAMEITALLVQNGKVADYATVPIVARHVTVN